MDAPIVSFNSVINSLNDTENAVKTIFQQCYEMIRDVISYSSDKQEDLMKLKMCLTLLAQSQKEMSSLTHAAMEISSLADRSKMTKEEAVQKFEQLLNVHLNDEIDENQQQIISSLESYMQNNGAGEEEDSDSELLVTKATQSYKDPLTQRIMEDPLKSKVCNHAYERSSIMEYLSYKSKKCPYSGCKSMLKKEDLVDHFVLKMHLLGKMKEGDDS